MDQRPFKFQSVEENVWIAKGTPGLADKKVFVLPVRSGDLSVDRYCADHSSKKTEPTGQVLHGHVLIPRLDIDCRKTSSRSHGRDYGGNPPQLALV
jgi:hypothetical protein